MKAKKNTATLTRTSAFRENRKNYLTESGYIYYRWDEDLKKELPVNITLGEEFQNADGTTGTIDRGRYLGSDPLSLRQLSGISG